MSYRYYVPNRKPVAFWLMDDTSPYQEHGGLSYVANTRSGYSAATTSTPLVAGAAFSSVFSRTKQGEFNCPLFQQNAEKTRFALESWVLPIQRSTGYNQQNYRENLALNPNSETTAFSFEGSGTGTISLSSTQRINGTNSTKFVWVSGSRGISISSAVTGVAGGAITLPANKTYVVSFHVYSESGQLPTFAFTDNAYASAASSLISSNSAVTATGAWQRLYYIFNTNTVQTFRIHNMATASATYYVDAIMLEETNSVKGYFDGSMPGYEWAGTTNASISRSRTDVAYANSVVNTNTFVASSSGQTFATSSPSSGGPFNGPYTRKTYTATTTMATSTDIFTTSGNFPNLAVATQGKYAYLATWVRSSIAAKVHLQAQYISNGVSGAGATGSVNSSDVTLVPNTWTILTLPTPALGATVAGVRLDIDSATSGVVQFNNGDTFDASMGTIIFTDSPLASGSIAPFNGDTVGAVWTGTTGSSPSVMLISQSEQQVLGNAGQMDGITINGTVVSFVTKYLTTGECRCQYDMGTLASAHVVGIHTEAGNQLYVNGVLVDNELLTDAQKGDKYITTDTKLYSGTTTSSQEIAVNGIAVYSNITPAEITQNYNAGIKVVPQQAVGSQFDGVTFNMNGDSGSKYLDRVFKDNEDFEDGLDNGVQINSDLIGPEYDTNRLSVAGNWVAGVAIDDNSPTSIYGIMVEWSGIGITVDASLDGTTWSPITNGSLISIIPNGFDPRGYDLQVRVSFAAGMAFGYAFLESLRVVGFLNNTFSNSQQRTITTTYPAVLREDYEPILYRDDNGVSLHGATLTIGPDQATTPVSTRTLELWIKPLTLTPAINVSGTQYRNGVADSSALPIGEWSLIHIVAPSDITTNITVTGDCIIGQVTLYQNPLTAAQILALFKSYTGASVISFVDAANITIQQQSPVPATLYAHDWAIDGGGG